VGCPLEWVILLGLPLVGLILPCVLLLWTTYAGWCYLLWVF